MLASVNELPVLRAAGVAYQAEVSDAENLNAEVREYDAKSPVFQALSRRSAVLSDPVLERPTSEGPARTAAFVGFPEHDAAVLARRRRALQARVALRIDLGAAVGKIQQRRSSRRSEMLAVFVHVHVKAGKVEAFRAATQKNAQSSLTEPGVARFDVIQEESDETRFVLIEVYKNAAAPAEHKETAHYRKWRDAVADMMEEPRRSTKYRTLFPEECRWATSAASGD